MQDIAREPSILTKTLTRRYEKLKENYLVEFGILGDVSSMQLGAKSRFLI